MKPRALVVDDDPDIIQTIEDILLALDHDFDTADSLAAAREAIGERTHDYFILDLQIPMRSGRGLSRIQNGMTLIDEINRNDQRARRIIVITANGNDSPHLCAEIMKMNGVADYVPKPFAETGKTLEKVVQEVLGLAGAAVRMQIVPLPKPAEPRVDKAFRGGEMIFYNDRVELHGIDICSGPRCASHRLVLELLSQKRSGDDFVAFSCEDLETEARKRGAQGGATGWIRDLRAKIADNLQQEEVILSGGPGYRFSPSLTVRYAAAPQITDITDTSARENVRNVRNHDVRDVRNAVVLDVRDQQSSEAAARRAWILEQLQAGIKLQAPMIAKHFGKDRKTAQRDLDALRNDERIEYFGAARTGYYRLCQISVTRKSSG